MISKPMKVVMATLIVLSLSAGVYVIDVFNRHELTAYEQYAREKIRKKQAGQVKAEAPELHGIIQRELRTRHGDDMPKYRPNQVMEEFVKARARKKSHRTSAETLNFIERGPGNIGGRTRALVVDPDDPNQETFYAGAASGGIWKTTNAGGAWTYISSDIPNMGVNTLVMAPSNTNVLYAGTGEHFTSDIDGAGMFKSSDRGETWEQIADPTSMTDFKNVSRIAVDPNDENTVVATTRSSVWGAFAAAIYKTTDGGISWTRLVSSTSQRFDDIAFDPTDFNTLYVAVRASGVIKSIDGGETWTDSSTGMEPTGRVEIDISPVNSTRLWASVEGSLSGNSSDLYVSNDGAETWELVLDESGTNEEFLGGQGWYDNIITAHPFDEDIVYVGAVNTWKFELTGGESSEVKTLSVDEDGTEEFMTFINFGGEYLGGGMQLGSVAEEDLLPVEIRFGEGTQKAHRFTVGGQGSGVSASGYTYEDYVEVPFQVWDTENNVQLMASFRDQQEDGSWNLIESNTSGASTDHSREYLFIHNIEYSETESASIAQTGGHEEGQMYFFWPVLVSGATFDANNLPVSSLDVVFNTTTATTSEITVVSDAYSQYTGVNAFPQSTRSSGLHPDQHNIVMYDLDSDQSTFRMLVGNDGGVYRTVSSTDPGTTDGDYEFISYGYNTTQFYSADKAPGENRYAGGMQDNGTWYHATGVEGAADATATFGISGDGFETVWHGTDEDKIIGGSQYNNFAKTTNGGTSWSSAITGYDDQGPFISRIAQHKSEPDRLFTVGALGVWKSTTFGSSWSACTLNNDDLWTLSNSTDVEISYANPEVIWAGGYLQESARLFVSEDAGESFNPCSNYTDFDMGSVSGIGTHPEDDQVAYVLFSFAGYPKVLKTTDLGETWVDISGFDGTGEFSDRGFPDVAVNCLMVFPNNTDRIWVGSEIGIIESLDGGESWSLLESNMPPVNIYDFKIVDDQIVIATYGRGIWSVVIEGILEVPTVAAGYTSITGDWVVEAEFDAAFDSVEIYMDDELVGTEVDLASGENTLSIDPLTTDGLKSTSLVAYLNGVAYASEESEFFFFTLSDPVNTYESDFSSASSDFASLGFTVSASTEISDNALNSDHPYENGAELISYLKVPIEVDENLSGITYDDIAIVEPGESGSEFGEDSFNDYVALEVSDDGKNWVAMGDGYDASLYSNWLEAYSGGEVTSELFQTHSLALTDYFSSGQWILLRFRLYANESTSAYGWVIDNLSIQTTSILAAERSVTDLRVFPNPITDQATLIFQSDLPSKVEVYDLKGKVVDQISLGTEKTVMWTPKNDLKRGVYFIRYQIGDELKSKKIILN